MFPTLSKWRRQIREKGEDIIIFLTVTIAAISIGFAAWYGFQTHQLVGEIRHSQMENSTVLSSINTGLKKDDQIITTLKAEVKSLQSGNATVSLILAEAGQAVQTLEGTQATILQDVKTLQQALNIQS